MSSHEYSVVFSKKVRKCLLKIPLNIRDKFFILAEQLAEQGPVAATWSLITVKLGPNEYHCHLGIHGVTCWTHEKGNNNNRGILCGSRENAPY